MEITKNTIEHIANLSRLDLTEEEKSMLLFDMKQIIAYMDKLKELDTSKVKPTAHVMQINNVFREDKSEPSYPKEKLLVNAPLSEGGCFKVPKVVE